VVNDLDPGGLCQEVLLLFHPVSHPALDGVWLLKRGFLFSSPESVRTDLKLTFAHVKENKN
jgi:hypothetical protein